MESGALVSMVSGYTWEVLGRGQQLRHSYAQSDHVCLDCCMQLPNNPFVLKPKRSSTQWLAALQSSSTVRSCTEMRNLLHLYRLFLLSSHSPQPFWKSCWYPRVVYGRVWIGHHVGLCFPHCWLTISFYCILYGLSYICFPAFKISWTHFSSSFHPALLK